MWNSWKVSESNELLSEQEGLVIVDELEHLWVAYPGTLRYSMAEQITALPLREIGTLVPHAQG